MPRIPDEYLDCVVYMYPSIPAAEAGQGIGGTGFVVGLQSEADPSVQFAYVITNKHVIDRGSTTVRFNNSSGAHESHEYDERNWIRAKDADLAAYLLPENPQNLLVRPIHAEQFITRQKIEQLKVGIGDEVFFAGRFINAEGLDRNRPSLRFGTIAQTGTQIIDGEESFLVEARSIPGYSGSPVFFYVMAGVPRGILSASYAIQPQGPWLIGVDWSHINDYVDAQDERGNKLPFKIRSNSGMMGVVPIWKLEELLFRPDVKEARMKDKRNRRAASPDASGSAASRDVALPPNDENPKHLEDFTALLNEAARKRPQDDQT